LLDRSLPAGTYNVASGHAVPLQRVVELLVDAAGVPVTVERDPSRLRPAEVRVVAGDASRLRAATGWEPAIPLEQTVADVLEAAQQTAQPARMQGS
jgi:GDP-4-dehydro-6-deoxy-D-mannose reductase